MKKILLILSIALSTSLFVACETEEKVIDFVFENTKNGAILRQVSASGDLDLFNPTGSNVTVVLEYQDGEGSLAQNILGVDVTLDFVDKSNPANNKSGVSFGAVTGWSADGTPFGLPRATFTYNFANALAAVGISAADVDGGDTFRVNFNLSSNSGNFGPGDANGNIGAVGGWYSSPYLYQNSVVCLLPETFATGTYKLEADKVMFGGAYGPTFSEEVTITATGAVGRTFTTDYLGFGLTQAFDFDLVCGFTLAKTMPSGLRCSVAIEWGPAASGDQGTFNAADDSTFTIIIENDATGDCGDPAQTLLTFTKI